MECKYNINSHKVYKFIMPVIKSNMYVIVGNKQALIIDPYRCVEATDLLKNNGVLQVTVILTHEHYDHISGVNYYRELFECEVIGSYKTAELVQDATKNLAAFYMAMFISRTEEEIEITRRYLDDKYTCYIDIAFDGEYQLEFEDINIKLLEAPGHSMGSICLSIGDRYIFTGDSLVQGAKIVTRLPGGNKSLYREITKPYLEALPKAAIIYPGHGEESFISELEIV